MLNPVALEWSKLYGVLAILSAKRLKYVYRNALYFLFFFSELYYDRGNHHEFTSLVKELARPGELTQSTSYSFEFLQVEKPYETYTGANVRLR